MAVIFISHSSKDEELIKKLEIIEALKQAGFENIFLDFDEKKGIKLGEKWEEKIKKEIKKSHIVILLLSPNWIKSKWCFAEFKIAQTLGKTILPVIIDNTNNKIYNWINENLKEQADITTDKNRKG